MNWFTDLLVVLVGTIVVSELIKYVVYFLTRTLKFKIHGLSKNATFLVGIILPLPLFFFYYEYYLPAVIGVIWGFVKAINRRKRDIAAAKDNSTE